MRDGGTATAGRPEQRRQPIVDAEIDVLGGLAGAVVPDDVDELQRPLLTGAGVDAWSLVISNLCVYA